MYKKQINIIVSVALLAVTHITWAADAVKQGSSTNSTDSTGSAGSPQAGSLQTNSTSFATSLQATAKTGRHLFILSGQSNMAFFDQKKSFMPAVENAFGKENVTVVKNAVPGRPIANWYKLTKAPEKNKSADGKGELGPLYEALMKEVKAATAGKTYDTVTFLWMQGESDAGNGNSVYAESFNGLLAQLKADLGIESINFVIGRISDARMGNPNWVKIREIQVKLAGDDPHGEWINTDDLNDRVDKDGKPVNGMHYTKEGYKILGQRFAEKAIALIKKATPPPNPEVSGREQTRQHE